MAEMQQHGPSCSENSRSHSRKTAGPVNENSAYFTRCTFISPSPTPSGVAPNTYQCAARPQTSEILLKKYNTRRFLDSEVQQHRFQLSPCHYNVGRNADSKLSSQLNRYNRVDRRYLENFGLGRQPPDDFYYRYQFLSLEKRIPISFNASDRFATPKRRSLSVFIGPGSYNLRK